MGGEEDTGWFLCFIDAAGFEQTPEEPWRWLGDPWPVDIADADVDALVKLGREQGREALLAEAR